MKRNTGEDRAFKILANRYVEQIGNQLNQEAAEKKITALPLPQKKRQRKIGKIIAAGAAVAAAFVFFIVGSFYHLEYTERSNEKNMGYSEEVKPVLTLSGDRFKIADHMEDRGKDVYLIEEAMDDRAVITIEKGHIDQSGMQWGYIYGKPVLYKAEEGYKILLYEIDNYVVTLSCRYELNTLIELYKTLSINF